MYMSWLLQDSLQEQTTHGNFVPHSHEDILNTIIERLKHPGRVRVAGSGVTITQHFGQTSYASNSSFASINPQ